MTFPITISAPDVANGQYQGRINLVPRKGGNNVTIPVAFVKKQGAVTLTNTCTPAELPGDDRRSRTAPSTAANFGSSANGRSASRRSASGRPPLQERRRPGLGQSAIRRGRPVERHALAGAPAAGDRVHARRRRAVRRYVPLSSLGVPPVAASATTRSPTSRWRRPSVRRRAVHDDRRRVNGYVVLGGGTSADIVFTPQHFPNAARPNNVIAPMWSDLNPPQQVRATSTWLISARVLSAGRSSTGRASRTSATRRPTPSRSGSPRRRPSTGEQITIAYGPDGNAARAIRTPARTGARRTVTARAGRTSPPRRRTTRSTASTAPPAAGGSVTIPFDMASKKAGTFHSDATLTSDQTPGTTVASADAHGHAVARATDDAARGRLRAAPRSFWHKRRDEQGFSQGLTFLHSPALLFRHRRRGVARGFGAGNLNRGEDETICRPRLRIARGRVRRRRRAHSDDERRAGPEGEEAGQRPHQGRCSEDEARLRACSRSWRAARPPASASSSRSGTATSPRSRSCSATTTPPPTTGSR